ncbi:DUF2244 domain-containing protein [Candidatus Spongiihabitans sp.]|uniref:DUF2244 domain-containing protein n=1 Tax=Candidatus Spongiihabitans sp. TaxID=3101308 RepID=UPI003C7BD215
MPAHAEFVIRPNSACHPRSWHKVFALLVVVCLSIASRFALLGYWMILPFALMDVLAVGLILRLVARQSAYIETIRVDGEKVEIQHIQKNNNASWQFPLHWIQVNLQSPQHRWYPHKLLLGSAGKWVEIGRCLTNEERITLAQAIRNQVLRFDGIDKGRWPGVNQPA